MMLRKFHCFCRLFPEGKLTDLFPQETFNPDSQLNERKETESETRLWSTRRLEFGLISRRTVSGPSSLLPRTNVFDKGFLWTFVDFVVLRSASPRYDRPSPIIIYSLISLRLC